MSTTTTPNSSCLLKDKPSPYSGLVKLIIEKSANMVCCSSLHPLSNPKALDDQPSAINQCSKDDDDDGDKWKHTAPEGVAKVVTEDVPVSRQPLSEKPVTENQVQKGNASDVRVTFQTAKEQLPDLVGWDPSHSLWQNKNAVRQLDQKQMEILLASLQQSRRHEKSFYA